MTQESANTTWVADKVERMPPHVTVGGTQNISLSYFDERDVDLLSERISRLRIHESAPRIVEVEDCVVPPGRRKGTKRSGVYDRNNALVEGSVRTRGESSESVDDKPDRAELVRAKSDSRPAYYLGRGGKHFGHFLLETFCRAWAWEKYGADRVPLLQSAIPPYAYSMYKLISPRLADSIRVVSEATRFSNVVVPHPGFVLKREAYLEFKHLCVRMAQRVMGTREEMSGQPVYLSRSGLDLEERRTLLGERRLERLLEGEGVRVVRPETLSIVDQITLFNTHKWIIAPMGSACHGRLFATRSTNLIMLCRNDFTTNLPLCDRLNEGMALYVNVLSGLSATFRYRESLVLHEQRLLHFLKELGMVRTSAAFDKPEHALVAGKRQWLQEAKEQANSRPDETLLRAIAEVEASLCD